MGEALLLLREQSERCEASTTNWAYYSPCDAPGTFDWVMTNHCMPDSPE